jgi:tetratricopeptide (TPR) repeat protein
VRAAQGEFAEADEYLQLAINWHEYNLPIDPKIADDLLQSVTFCRGMKNYERALAILNRVIPLHRRYAGVPSVPVADDFSRRAQIQNDRKDLPAAILDLQTALQLRTEIKGAMDVSLVPDLDRLGAAQIAQRAYPEAEEAYRKSLIIRESLLGREDPDLIASIDGLAYAIFGQKKYEQAEPIYQRLVALWIKSVGETHPMVAMALDKVAVFYAEQKKYDAARDAAEHANAIRAHFLAAGLSAAAAEQLVETNREDSLALYRRAIATLDPPNPVYDELRAEDEQIVKALTAPAKPAAKAPPRKKP